MIFLRRRRPWFDAYLKHRQDHPLILDVIDWKKIAPEAGSPISTDPFYQMLQLSGLIYGFPVFYPFEDEKYKKLPPAVRVRYLLLDMLMFTAIQEMDELPGPAYCDKVQLAATWIKNYYLGQGAVQDPNKADNIEEVIFKRIVFRRSWLDFSGKGINSHLFWDWYFFRRYIRDIMAGKDYDQNWFRALVEEKKSMKLLTQRLIIAAFHCDQSITRQEKILQHHFLKSARLFPKSTRLQVSRWMKSGVSLFQIRFPEMEPVAKRYLLDTALLALLADQEYSETEQSFAEALAKKLGLSETDSYAAKVDMGSFLLRHADRLSFVDLRKGSWLLLMHAFEENMNRIGHAAGEEYRETVDMAMVFGQLLKQRLKRGSTEELPSEEEIINALEQIQDLPRFLPFFTLFFVPVPGVTEFYIFLAYGLEKLSGNRMRLLPSNFSRMVKKKK